jgi:cytoskeletal protein RodZ
VSIEGVLAQARQRAGLSVAQVSQRTRIRETIIESIEGGDYSACGGDFYARGHIRAIATVVGADPGPLIGEYDAACRAPGALSAVSLDELLTPAKTVGRHRPGWAAMLGLALGLGLVAGLGFVAYQFRPSSPHARPAAAGTVPPRPGGRGGTPPAA